MQVVQVAKAAGSTDLDVHHTDFQPFSLAGESRGLQYLVHLLKSDKAAFGFKPPVYPSISTVHLTESGAAACPGEVCVRRLVRRAHGSMLLAIFTST